MVVAPEYPREAQQGEFRKTDLVNPAGGADLATARGERTVRHSVYLDENWFCRMIGDKVVDRDYHGLGFCPANRFVIVVALDKPTGNCRTPSLPVTHRTFSAPLRLALCLNIHLWS